MNELDHGGGHVPVAVTDRNGFDESVHFGSVVAGGAAGGGARAVGTPAGDVYARSARKPARKSGF